MPHKLPRRSKDGTYLALTQKQEINHPDKPLANANVQRLLKPGTCCENNIAQTISNASLFVPMNCWNLGTKGYVSFNWCDVAAANNNKTPPPTRRRSRRTQPQEVTPLPKTTKLKQRQDAADNDFDNEVLNLRRQQRRWYDNNDKDNKTPTSTMEIIDKRLT